MSASHDAPKVVVFGAGATGRGHVGLLAWEAGARVVFADTDEALIRALERAGGYRVNLYGGKAARSLEVRNARYLSACQREAVAQQIVEADLVLTSVFDQNLGDVAITVARAVSLCRQAGRRRPLNFVACENMQNSSSKLREHARSRLAGEDLDYCDRLMGFPDCMISRVVPRPEPDPLIVTAEDYNEWTARREDFLGPAPGWLPALRLVDNQDALLERKLFIHNGGHAICGYFGFHFGLEFIHQAVADARVAGPVVGACDQIGEAVRRKHGFSPESIEEYKRDLYRRGAIPEMRDRVLRVVRQPARKLGPNERLLGPARLAEQFGLPRDKIIDGIVAALKYCHPTDAQSVEMQRLIAEAGVKGAVCRIGGLAAGEPLLGEIEAGWNRWDLPKP